MRRNLSILALKLIGVCVSTVPPLLAVISYFPIWGERGASHVISGISLIFIVISFLPIYKIIKKKLESPSVHTVWLAVFVCFFLLARIAEEIKVISFVGFISNTVGALFFKLAERKEAEIA